ncbi:MAG: hypothetical protein KDB01_01345 [Planctomycetaceae bacterium]|nr:hypothetical protein [Planctomycetaceae bacterium]
MARNLVIGLSLGLMLIWPICDLIARPISGLFARAILNLQLLGILDFNVDWSMGPVFSQNLELQGKFLGMLGLPLFWMSVFRSQAPFHPRWVFWCGIVVGIIWLYENNFWGLVIVLMLVLTQSRFRDEPQQSESTPETLSTGLRP